MELKVVKSCPNGYIEKGQTKLILQWKICEGCGDILYKVKLNFAVGKIGIAKCDHCDAPFGHVVPTITRMYYHESFFAELLNNADVNINQHDIAFDI